MSTNQQQRQRNRHQHQPRSPYQEQCLADAQKQWRWSEWMLAKLRTDHGKQPHINTEEEIIEWHRKTTTR